MPYQLAQVNIAQLIAPIDDPLIADFVNLLDEINELAEQSDGFIWRLKDDQSNNALDLNPFNDPLIVVNLSVWESVEKLKRYAYHTKHVEVFKRRKEWFHPMKEAHMALWWIEEGQFPTPMDSRHKIEELRVTGPTPSVFTFQREYPSPK